MGVFDRWTKKATENAIETTKETLNDKLQTYSGIIKIGLTIGVIVFGSKKINQHVSERSQTNPQGYSQQPIVINNYYDRGYITNGRQQNKQFGQKH